MHARAERRTLAYGLARPGSAQVARNWAPQLAGNVYVQYADPPSAAKACAALNGATADGVPVVGHLVAIADWRTTLCGRFDQGRCDQGKRCPFVHAFANPNRQLERLRADGSPAV